jgi:hypothetical protein
MLEQKGLPVVKAGLDRGRELFEKRQNDPSSMAKFEASLMDNTKNAWSRLGAFDPKERSHTLDLLGFEMQWAAFRANHQIDVSGITCQGLG